MAYTKHKEIVSRIVHKHDTEANWQKATSFIPMLGEIIVYDIDTTHEHERFKIGDGQTLVNNLPFQVDISNFEDYKVKQEPVVNPTANGSSLAFIDSISQDEMGKITVTKKNVGKVSTAGTADKLASLTVSLTGDITGTQTITNGNSISVATELTNTGVTAGSYGTDGKVLNHGDKFTVPNFNVDEDGRLTAASNKEYTLPKASLYYVEGSGSTVDSTAKVATWKGTSTEITSYYPGLTIAYKLDVDGSTSTTLNINELGAVTVVRNATTAISTAYPVGAVAFLTYTLDGTTAYWKAGDYDANTTYTNVKLGHGYATCSTAAATVAKTAALSSYTLVTGGRVSIRFTNGNTVANPTLNINSKGAKYIYYQGAKLTDVNLIKPGDVVTFVYSSYYYIVAINGKYFDAQTVFGPTENATPGYGGTFTVPSYTVTADGRIIAGADRTITMPGAQDLSNYKTKQPDVSDPTASGNATAFIDSISQNANGVITVTKKNVIFPDYSSTYKKVQTAVSSPTASGNTTAFIDTISQDAQGKITVTKKNVQFPDYSNTYQPKGDYKTKQTAVSSPSASGSATAFIDTISQDTNGKITVTKKNITAAALGLDRAISFLGTTTTTLTDGATTNPITISEASITAAKGDVVIVSGTDQEFIWTGSAWEEFGNASSHSIKGHTHDVSVSGSVSEFVGTITKSKPEINVTVGTHPGITISPTTDSVLGSATTFTGSSSMDNNVVTGATTRYLGIGAVALNTDTVTEVTENTDIVATKTVFGTATSASKITSSNVTAAGAKTDGTAISIPQYTFADIGASKINSWSAGSSTNVSADDITAWSAGTMSVSGETLTLTLPSLTYTAVTASKVTVPSLSYSAVTASKATAGTAISVPQHTHAANVTASKITGNTSITVPVVSSNAEVTASKITTANVTVATSVKTQPTLTAYTATATGRIAYITSVSTGKVGITTTVTAGTNDKVNALTNVSASTSSPSVTAALASDVVTAVGTKTKTVTLSGTTGASTN